MQSWAPQAFLDPLILKQLVCVYLCVFILLKRYMFIAENLEDTRNQKYNHSYIKNQGRDLEI